MKEEIKVILKGQECENCKYQWFARVEKPRQCPNCKRQINYLKVKDKSQTSGVIRVRDFKGGG
ncbi:MAG: hypothetical protein AABY22_00760 [Nanoarchaeota archaeon]